MNACFLTFIQNKKLKKKSYVRMNMCVCKEIERERERFTWDPAVAVMVNRQNMKSRKTKGG